MSNMGCQCTHHGPRHFLADAGAASGTEEHFALEQAILEDSRRVHHRSRVCFQVRHCDRPMQGLAQPDALKYPGGDGRHLARALPATPASGTRE